MKFHIEIKKSIRYFLLQGSFDFNVGLKENKKNGEDKTVLRNLKSKKKKQI